MTLENICIKETNDEKKRLVIVGTSSTARTIYSFVSTYDLFEVIGFAVNQEYIKQPTFCDLPVYALETLDTVIDKENDYLFVAIQWNRLNADRRKAFEYVKSRGFKMANLISPSAIVNGKLKGENCWIADLAILDFNVEIGDDVFVKVNAFIGPNSKVHQHCFIGAKSLIAGGCCIGEQSFIGLGATVFDQTNIGNKCIVGACSVVKRNMPDFTRCKTSSNSVDYTTYTEDVIESKLMFAKNVRTPIS